MESPPKEKSCTLPTTKTKKQKIRQSRRQRGLFGEFGSSLHEGSPGVGVVETVDVGVQNDLMRAHVVVLKDGGESVVLVVEALVTPVGVDRSSRSRESATGAAGAAG